MHHRAGGALAIAEDQQPARIAYQRRDARVVLRIFGRPLALEVAGGVVQVMQLAPRVYGCRDVG
jgi:hypothetical protein